MLNYNDYEKEVWDEESYEVDGIPTSIQEAYKESLNRDIGSLHEEYC